MKSFFLLFICYFITTAVVLAQETQADSLLLDLETTTPEKSSALLPERMLLTQRLFWGEKGLYRKVGLAPQLTAANRERELRIRRNMFKVHQAVGFLTAAGMIAQGIIGSRLYKPATYSDKLQSAHKATGLGVQIGYATTALMAFTSPPPLVNRKGISNIKVHRYLSYLHLTGMITTSILGPKIKQDFTLKPYHRAAAYTTFASYLGAMVVLKFEF
jgi:hypothetical protein